MNWLFVTSRCPWPLTHGGWLRTYHLGRALVRAGEAVSVLSYAPDAEAAAAYAEAGIALPAGPEGAPPQRGPGRSWMSPYVFDAALASSVARRAGDFDVVVLAGPKCLQYSPEARAAGRVLADIVDDPVLVRARQTHASRKRVSWRQRLRLALGETRHERRFLEGVDRVVFVSSQDAEQFRARHEEAEPVVVPNGVDTEYFHPDRHRPAEPQGPPTVTFLGNMAHEPNDDAADVLLREIAPRVWDQCPDARFVVVGQNPSAAIRALAAERAIVTGRVDDVRPHLAAATVVSLPMLTGTGIKNKLLEAWAMEAPVVATSLACQGVPARDGSNLLVADGPAAHAAAIVRMLSDRRLRERLGAHGRRTVKDELTWARAARRMWRLCAPDPGEEPDGPAPWRASGAHAEKPS